MVHLYVLKYESSMTRMGFNGSHSNEQSWALSPCRVARKTLLLISLILRQNKSDWFLSQNVE